MIIFTIIITWVIQAMLCVLINIAAGTRIPNGVVDFFRLTFLPTLIGTIYDKKHR